MNAVLRVEVVYALTLEQDCTSLECTEGTRVRQAIEASGVLQRHPEVDLSSVGIWGRRCGLDDAVSDGDRVEIYRPLTADPKETRRRRAQVGRASPTRR
jgi:putative ubiquitin-RnfH superfamily antitoxin RatB of RatAB toxin-antitoxin module